MTVDVRSDVLVLLDLPGDFTLPESFPVTWNAELGAFSIPRRHPSVSSLLQLLVNEGHLAAVPPGVGRRAPIRSRFAAPRGASGRPFVRAAA